MNQKVIDPITGIPAPAPTPPEWLAPNGTPISQLPPAGVQRRQRANSDGAARQHRAHAAVAGRPVRPAAEPPADKHGRNRAQLLDRERAAGRRRLRDHGPAGWAGRAASGWRQPRAACLAAAWRGWRRHDFRRPERRPNMGSRKHARGACRPDRADRAARHARRHRHDRAAGAAGQHRPNRGAGAGRTAGAVRERARQLLQPAAQRASLERLHPGQLGRAEQSAVAAAVPPRPSHPRHAHRRHLGLCRNRLEQRRLGEPWRDGRPSRRSGPYRPHRGARRARPAGSPRRPRRIRPHRPYGR